MKLLLDVLASRGILFAAKKFVVPSALVVTPCNIHEIANLKKVGNEVVVFQHLQNYQGKLPVFHAAKAVFWYACDDNTTYYKWSSKTFPACQAVVFCNNVDAEVLQRCKMQDVVVGMHTSAVMRARRHFFTSPNIVDLECYPPLSVHVQKHEKPVLST